MNFLGNLWATHIFLNIDKKIARIHINARHLAAKRKPRCANTEAFDTTTRQCTHRQIPLDRILRLPPNPPRVCRANPKGLAMTTAYTNEDTILTTAEAADFARLHKTTVFLAIKRGDLKAFNVCPGGRKKYRVMKSDLIAWLTASPSMTKEAA